MKWFDNLKLSIKLPLMLVAIAIVALSIMGAAAYRSAKALLEESGAQQLELTLASRMTEIENWTSQVDANMRARAANQTTVRALQDFRVALHVMGEDATQTVRALYPTENPFSEEARAKTEKSNFLVEYTVHHARLHTAFVKQAEQWDINDLFLVDASGQVVYSLWKGPEFAENLNSAVLSGTQLARVTNAVLEAGGTDLSVSPFEVTENGRSAEYYIASAVLDRKKEPIGAVVAKVRTDRLNLILSRSGGLGETGLAYLADDTGTILNQLRGVDEPTVLSAKANDAVVQKALADERGILETVGVTGEAAVIAYHPFTIYGRQFAIGAEQSTQEIHEPAASLAASMLLHASWNVAILAVMAWLMARSVANPLSGLGRAIDLLAKGDRHIDIPLLGRKDEVGNIAGALELLRSELASADAAQFRALLQGAAFDASSAAMMMVDKDFNILHCNPAQQKLFAKDVNDFKSINPDQDYTNLVGTNMDRFHDNPERVRAVLSNPENLPFHADLVIGQGRYGLDVSAIHNEAGEQVGYVVEWRNVTELRLQRALLDAIDEAQVVCEVDPEMRVLRANANFCKALGCSEDYLRGKDVREFMSLDDANGDISQILMSGKPIQGVMRFASDQGALLLAEGSLTPVPDRSNRIFKILLIGNDVTKARQSLAEALESNRIMIEGQNAVVDALKIGLDQLSAGDLSSSIEMSFPDEYEALRFDFNAAVNKLGSAMQMVIDNAASIDGEAQEITNAAEDLSRRTEQQAATLEETAAALDELTASVKSASEGVSEADRVVKEARDSAEASGEVVAQAVAAMSEIEESSSQISKIIGVIDEIAFQTNLLALNAGVEAARAGEAGRGFAVVASEVRALAQRSSEAAREIDGLITASSGYVQRGVELVGETGEALKGILHSVLDVASRVSEIAASSREQAAGLIEINSAMNQLDQVTQQNAAMFEETTAASHSLSRGAETLKAVTRQFRTADISEVEKAAPLTPAAPVSTLSASVGNLALSVPPENDEWEDF